jgi:outer membrane protein W
MAHMRRHSFTARIAGIVAPLLLALWAAPVCAQGVEVGVFGGEVLSETRHIQAPAGGTIQVNSNYAAGLHFDYRLTHSRIVDAHLELEFTVLPPRIVKSASTAVPQSYDSLYLTPGVRVEFIPRARLRPWVAAGGGYTLYLQSQVLTNGQTYRVRFVNSAAADYGGGLDLAVWRSRHYSWSLNLRGQVRDFVSGNPSYNAPLTSSVQHNVVATGGFVVAHQSAYLP